MPLLWQRSGSARGQHVAAGGQAEGQGWAGGRRGVRGAARGGAEQKPMGSPAALGDSMIGSLQRPGGSSARGAVVPPGYAGSAARRSALIRTCSCGSPGRPGGWSSPSCTKKNKGGQGGGVASSVDACCSGGRRAGQAAASARQSGAPQPHARRRCMAVQSRLGAKPERQLRCCRSRAALLKPTR